MLYNICVVLQIIVLILSFGMIFFLIQNTLSTVKHYLFMTWLLLFLYSGGILLNLLGTTKGSYTVAQIISNVGFLYSGLFFDLFILSFYSIPFARKIKISLVTVDILLVSMCFLAHRHTLLYKSSWVVEGEHPYLGYVPGVGYYVMSFVFALQFFIPFVITAYSMRKYDYEQRRRDRFMLAMTAAPIPCLIIAPLISPPFFKVTSALMIITLFVPSAYILKKRYLDLTGMVHTVAVEDMSQAMIITDTDYRLVYSNKSAKQIFPELDAPINTSLKGLCPDAYNLFVMEDKDSYKKDGRYYSVSIEDSFARNTLIGHYVLLIDQTEKMRFVQNLIEAKQEAEDANRAKSLFLANMSHEVRTPMNAILGMTELIRRADTTAEIHEMADSIKESGDVLLDIINEILDISKIESGKMEIVKAPFDLNAMLDSVNRLSFMRNKNPNVEIKLTKAQGLPEYVSSDEVRIRQILINLMGNAIKFTEKGKIELSVRSVRDESGVSLIFAVEDTGSGIREDDIEKIFSNFERVNSTKTHSIEGTGLGLSISRNLAALLGGSLSVQSVYGEGSTFTLTVPVEIVTRAKLSNAREDDSDEEFIAPDATILVVDDNPTNLKVAKGILQSFGVKAYLVSSGAQALEIVKRHSFDVIFMDHMMPEMDGIETFHRLTELEGGIYSDIPVIALTANAITGMRDMFLKEGFKDYVSKPIDMNELAKVLRRWIAKDKICVKENKVGK